MAKPIFRVLVVAMVLLVPGAGRARAWGCDGHKAIAIMAERLLGSTADRVRAVLTASPVDPQLKRYCEPAPSDPIADVSTWADDVRSVDPTTGNWHFIDIPRSAGSLTASYTNYCRNGDCIVEAIVKQFSLLKTSRDPRAKANALRFLIHFVGDIHQPLHTITNGDRGGNCVPVAYFSQQPREDENGNFSPNLHRVWDSDLIRTLMQDRGLTDANALATHIAGQSPQRVAAQAPSAALVASWARASNALARSVAYGRLQTVPPFEPAEMTSLPSCAGNNQVGRRMAALEERIGAAYAQAATPVIINQLGLAARRLAAVLHAAFSAP